MSGAPREKGDVGDSIVHYVTGTSFLQICSLAQHGFLYQSLSEQNESGIREVLGGVEWTPEAIQSLQDSVLNNDVFQICLSDLVVSASLGHIVIA